jgi:hypothetical protein
VMKQWLTLPKERMTAISTRFAPLFQPRNLDYLSN